MDGEWDESTQRDAALPLYWTVRLLCRLSYKYVGLRMVIFQHLLVKRSKLSVRVHCGKVFSRKIFTAHRRM